MNLFKTLVFSILVPGTLTVVLPYWLLASADGKSGWELGWLRWLGILPISLGVLIYLRCAGDFAFGGKGTPAPMDPPKELVVQGLYRYMRNPMYVGVIAILLGESLLFESLALLKLAGVSYVTFFLFVLLYEEPTLTRRFGSSYRNYRRMVPRWIPRLKGTREKSS